MVGGGDFVFKEKHCLLKGRFKSLNKMVFGKFDLEVEERSRNMNKADDLDLLGEEVQAIKRDGSSRFWLNLKIKENMLIKKISTKAAKQWGF